jgi:carotenoid cleavage dioxygenase
LSAHPPDLRETIDANGLPIMHEWTVDYTSSKVIEHALDDDSSEYPRVPDSHVGLPHRYAYTTSFILEAEPDHHEIYRYDLRNGAKRTSHRLGRGHTCGEPVFVPRDGGASEDDGYLLTFAHDRGTNLSYFLILDATVMGADPIAEVLLPVRVPGGFHGFWVPAPQTTGEPAAVEQEGSDAEPGRV